MKREEFVNYLTKFGWSKHRDETSAWVVLMRIENMTICCVPILKAIPGVWLTPTLSIDDFDIAQTVISGKNSKFAKRSIILQTKINERESCNSESDVKRYSDMMLDWAQAQDIEQSLKQLRELPTNCLGAMPARHLAALAVNGDVEILSGYKDSFAEGDRLDFVPYIDEGYIERALDFAKKRRANPDWLPDKPKPRI